MACNGLHFGILTNYSDTYFLKRLENEPTNLYVSRVVHPDSTNPTLRECVYYICQQAILDNVGNRLDPVLDDDVSSREDSDGDGNGDDNDGDYPDNGFDNDYIPSDSDGSSGNNYNSKKRKSSLELGSRKGVIASPSKGTITIGKYIGGGTFGKVFSGYYDG